MRRGSKGKGIQLEQWKSRGHSSLVVTQRLTLRLRTYVRFKAPLDRDAFRRNKTIRATISPRSSPTYAVCETTLAATRESLSKRASRVLPHRANPDSQSLTHASRMREANVNRGFARLSLKHRSSLRPFHVGEIDDP
ncbi:unnamed protein product [Rangifer tarandus platyrhynchus]|uniref:Uncharacterized protein n=1 Tax=Rangifer tarandus platyrhynchus TaxID=3082113 RepID=A0ABN8XKU4_RANTA|nr:unnamed protein product [Rangifer tarandus platyrhynchus]